MDNLAILKSENTAYISYDDIYTSSDCYVEITEGQLKNEISYIQFKGIALNKTKEDIFNTFSFSRKNDIREIIKENEYLFQAFINHRRQVRYLQLELLLESNQISDEEYEATINNNIDSYVLPMCEYKPSTFDFHVLCELMERIGEKDLSVNDVSEIFSLDLSGYEIMTCELNR